MKKPYTMKPNRKYIILLAVLSICSHAISQNLNSAYFMEGYAYGHEINPAKDYTHKSYFSVPLLPGNMNAATRGNMSLTNFFYKNPNGNGLVTYLHPDISVEEALKGFHKNNKLLSDYRYDLLSVGFHSMKGFNTISLAVRANVGATIPYDLFSLTKNLQNQDYDISTVGATASSWVELGLGHSHQITPALRIGGKMKILLGAAYARLNMKDLSLKLSGEDQWIASAHAEIEAGVKGFTWGEPETKEYNNPQKGTYQQIDFDNIDVDGPGLNGGGVALDMGVEWDLDKNDLVNGVKLSAALLDLGFIRWKNVLTAKNNGEDFIFEGFDDIKVENGDGTKFEDQADNLGDQLTDLYSLQDMGAVSKARALGATMNFGLEYTPLRLLKLGLLSTIRIQGAYGWHEERMVATLSPCRWFDISGSGSVGSLGGNLGWVINIHPKGFNFFLGSDHCVGKFSKQGIPLRSNYDISLGFNFPLGKANLD